MAKTARTQLEGRHLLFSELNIDGGKHVLALFLN